jgi:hypothetical protein
MRDPGEIRNRLAEIEDWGDGLTREEIGRRAPGLPGEILDQLPPDYRFSDVGSVMSYLRHMLAAGIVPDAVREVVGSADVPRGYGEAPTGQTVVPPDTEHGVGSGADPGFTGASSQAGVGQEGVAYTDASDSQAPTVSGEVILPSELTGTDDQEDERDERTKPGPIRRYRVDPERAADKD